jgi:hypothetical protein
MFSRWIGLKIPTLLLSAVVLARCVVGTSALVTVLEHNALGARSSSCGVLHLIESCGDLHLMGTAAAVICSLQ